MVKLMCWKWLDLTLAVIFIRLQGVDVLCAPLRCFAVLLTYSLPGITKAARRGG